MLKQIEVSAIQEYNTSLGSRCHLLMQNGLYPYENTDEEIATFLENSAADPDALSVCLESSRCSAFHDIFLRGETPFSDMDPIQLLEYNGKYWVYEGKHRVCLAKRAGFKTLNAEILQLEKDTEQLLPMVGSCGRYGGSMSFRFAKTCGQYVVLWVRPPRGYNWTRFADGPVILNAPDSKPCKDKEVIPGVAYSLYRRNRGRCMRKTTELEAVVNISPDHANTRIWLYTVPIDKRIKKRDIHTLYRYGLWRQKHLDRISTFSFFC